MKHLASLAIVAATTCVAVQAAPFMAVGDNAELFVTASAQIQSDDNIYAKSTAEVSDTIYSFTPGVDLVFGKGAVNKGNVYYREEFRRYADNNQQDTELSNVGATSSYNNGVTKFDLNASYAQVAQNDRTTVGTGAPADVIVRRDLTDVGAKAEFGISEKTMVGVGLAYAKTDYAPASYTDSDIWSLPVDVYYKATAKLDWSLGYRYRTTDLSGTSLDSDDHFFNLGARGEFSPKLTGQIRMGYNRRSFDGGGKEDQFGFNGDIAYAYSDKTDLRFLVGNDFGSSGTGDSTENFNLGLNVSNRFTEQWSINAGLTYRKTDYPTRTDDFMEAQVGVSYVYNAYINFVASVAVRDNSSDNLATAEFSQNVFSIGANVRY